MGDSSVRGSFRKYLFFALAAAVLWSQAHAQNPRGSLRGAVQDASGARIASARIIVKSADSSVQREAVTEDRGEFRLDDLVAGFYHITVSANGFAPANAAVSIAVSSVREVTVTLKPTAPGESITVESKSSSITTDSIDLASAVHQPLI